MVRDRPLAAVLWDFDGTLVDSRQKNLAVTRRIVARVTGRAPDTFPDLASVPRYEVATGRVANWRELYRALGLTDDETLRAGVLWTAYQLRDVTPSPFFDGIDAVLDGLRHLPHGIVSQNSRAHIRRAIGARGWAGWFRAVVGYEEVPYAKQKPAPDPLLLGVEGLAVPEPACILYVGDHEADMECARNADRVLRQRGSDSTVVGIAALWGGHTDVDRWGCVPAYRARRVADVLSIALRFSR